MGMFNPLGAGVDQNVWGYTKDNGEFMDMPEKEDFYSYTSETEREFNQEAFDEAMAEWHKTQPLSYWW